jgi:alkylhydroperoxidase/carboxymuconolactone decarboxylase family protein YurZ
MVRAAAGATQRRGKHVPAAMNAEATVEKLLEAVISALSVPSAYKRDEV